MGGFVKRRQTRQLYVSLESFPVIISVTSALFWQNRLSPIFFQKTFFLFSETEERGDSSGTKIFLKFSKMTELEKPIYIEFSIWYRFNLTKPHISTLQRLYLLYRWKKMLCYHKNSSKLFSEYLQTLYFHVVTWNSTTLCMHNRCRGD